MRRDVLVSCGSQDEEGESGTRRLSEGCHTHLGPGMGIKRWYELVALILEARDIVHLKIVEGFVFLSTLFAGFSDRADTW